MYIYIYIHIYLHMYLHTHTHIHSDCGVGAPHTRCCGYCTRYLFCFSTNHRETLPLLPNHHSRLRPLLSLLSTDPPPLCTFPRVCMRFPRVCMPFVCKPTCSVRTIFMARMRMSHGMHE